MRQLPRSALLLFFLALFGVSTVAAQVPRPAQRGATHPRSKGVWVTVGAGYASTGARCHECQDIADQSGPSVFLRIGGVMTRRAVIGVDALAWRKSDGGVTTTMGNVTISGQFYPRRTAGLFIKAGLGFGFYSQDGGLDVGGNGGAATLGLGYDIRVSPGLSLTPIADFNFGDLGEMQQDNTDVLTGWRQTIINVGLGVTIH
jgi:hypothetical protein